MPAINPRADREHARTMETLDRLALQLEAAGSSWIDPESADRIARAADLLGLAQAAERVRAAHRRRDPAGKLEVFDGKHQAVALARRPANRPILVVIDGGGEELSRDELDSAAWRDLSALADRYLDRDVSPDVRQMLEVFRRCAQRRAPRR